MTEARKLTKRNASRTAVHVAPVLLVAVWGVAWIASHASQHLGAHRQELAYFVLLAVVAGIGAAVLPARRAARLTCSKRSSTSEQPAGRHEPHP